MDSQININKPPKMKNPKRVEQGKRLALINKLAKEKKRLEQAIISSSFESQRPRVHPISQTPETWESVKDIISKVVPEEDVEEDVPEEDVPEEVVKDDVSETQKSFIGYATLGITTLAFVVGTLLFEKLTKKPVKKPLGSFVSEI